MAAVALLAVLAYSWLTIVEVARDRHDLRGGRGALLHWMGTAPGERPPGELRKGDMDDEDVMAVAGGSSRTEI
jgi:hypothetical protein